MLEAKAKFLEPRSTKCLLKQSCGSGELQDRGGEAALRAQESSPERISCPLAPRAPALSLPSSSKVFSMFLPLLSSHFLQKKHQKTRLQTRQRKTTENRKGITILLGLPGGSVVKNSLAKEGDIGLIPESGRSLGEGNGYPH